MSATAVGKAEHEKSYDTPKLGLENIWNISELVGGNSFLFWTLEALRARIIHMASLPPNQEAHQQLPSLSEIRELTQQRFGVWPCLWQLKVAHALLRGRDVVCTAGTGMGKTLTFWIPLLFSTGGIQIVITPLNLLGKQNTQALTKAGIRAIVINSETASHVNIAVSDSLLQD